MQIKITPSGPCTYLQIVQADRDPSSGEPRQRHIATLGRLEVVFCDLTTVRVHGEHEEEDDLGRWGKPKDGEDLERQYAVGLVQSQDGLPITHEVVPGNRSEAKTVKATVERLARRLPIRRIVLVADRGMISLDDPGELEGLELPGGRKMEYILAVPARRYREMTKDLEGLHRALLVESRRTGKESLRETVTGGRRLVVAHSPEIARRARRKRAAKLAEACRLANELSGKLKAQSEGRRRRGRPLTETEARLKLRDFLVEHRLTRLLQIDWKGDGFTWEWDVEELKRELALDGKLVMVSNVPDMKAAQLVARYKDRADIEGGSTCSRATSRSHRSSTACRSGSERTR